MRKTLDTLYRWSGGAAALCLLLIAAVVLAQVGANTIDAIAKAITGRAIGLVIPSYSDFAGFFLAGASFLALAHTLRHGAHIRVTLLLGRFGVRTRRLIEGWCLLCAIALAGTFAWYTVLLVAESYHYGDLSPGMVAVPLWIPQAAMALGLLVLNIALIDELVRLLRGETPCYQANDLAEQRLSQRGDSSAAADEI